MNIKKPMKNMLCGYSYFVSHIQKCTRQFRQSDWAKRSHVGGGGQGISQDSEIGCQNLPEI